MLQRGQVLRLKSRGRDGKALWAYRYRFRRPRLEASTAERFP
jgi:hypothetical protein